MRKQTPAIIPIEGVIKNYPWGSHSTLANHRGEVRSVEPEAELWFGDNPQGPSPVKGKSYHLDSITHDFGRLPFLAKILAVEHSLSLQVHPALDDIPRLIDVLKDDNHKPEMLVALTEFHALVGVAQSSVVLEKLRQLDSPQADALIAEPLRRGSTMLDLLDRILGVPDTTGILEEVRNNLGNLDSVRHRWMRELIELYSPKLDPLAFLLCELVILEPGASLYLPPRCIHAYLHGTVVEVMANSDNVIRGGLTNKPIDKKNFLAVVDTNSGLAQRITPESRAGVLHWRPPIEDFALMRFDSDHTNREQVRELFIEDHAIAFASDGSAVISTGETGGSGVLISQNDGALLAPGAYRLESHGSLWVVTGKGR